MSKIKKDMTILYKVHDNLYVNLTNKCPCSCTFCLRQTKDEMENSGSLWLEREPSVEEVKEEFNKFDMDKYKEVVFCGFGEPTERIDALVEIAAYVKENFQKPVRVNTNGLGSLIHGKDIAPMFKGVVDTVSISLNTPDRDKYYQLTKNRFGKEAYEGLLDFAKKVKAYVPNVVLTTVETTISPEEEKMCERICKELGVNYRIRAFE